MMKKKMWHCKNCGSLCDASKGVCPECGLDLGFYGEVQFVETNDPTPSPPPEPEMKERAAPPPPPQPVAERRQPEQEKKAKKERRLKEPKPPKKGNRIALLVGVAAAVMLSLLAVLAVLSFTVFAIKVDSFQMGEIERWDENYDNTYYVEADSRGTQEIKVLYKGFFGTKPELDVTSSNIDAVKVSVSGGNDDSYTVTLKAGSPGTSEITAQVGGESKSYKVEVYQITGVDLTVPGVSGDVDLGLGDSVDYTAQLQYRGTVSEKQLSDLEVTSSDSSVVEVNSKSGKLVTKGSGSAVIKASSGNLEKSITVNVFEITSIDLKCYDLLVDQNGKTMNWLPEGLTMKMDIIYHYDGVIGSVVPSYTLKSSNEKVLSVDQENFTITAVGSGKATITATLGGHTDSMDLEVYPVDRSTGAWVKGSIQSIATPKKNGTSEANCTITVRFGDGASHISAPIRCGEGGTTTQTKAWENVSDQYPKESHEVHSREIRFTLNGSKWDEDRTIAGIIFLFKRANSDTSDYNPATDLLDYWVIYTK